MDLSSRMPNKVPEVALSFWFIKMMSTTVGETAADFLIFDLDLGLVVASLIMSAILIVLLLIQIRKREYVPTNYWLVVVMVSIVGTLVSDYLVDGLGISLVTTTTVFAAGLAAVFAAWFATEKTLSIHTIFTTRRELFYWAAILFTFALGTSAGDLVAERLGLGYATSAVAFAAVIGAIYVAYRLGLDSVLAFWAAYILTRPFGASMGDLMSQPTSNGGLGLGTSGTSILFLTVIAGLVAYLTVRKSHTAPALPRERTSWTPLSVVLHWTIVVLILLQFLEGEHMIGLWDATTEGGALTATTQLLGWIHIVTGTAILLAAALRLLDRFRNGRPPHAEGEPAWATLLAKVTHFAIYVILITMPTLGLSAWITGIDKIAQLHALLWNPLIVLIGLHVVGALAQHFHFKSDALRRIMR